MTRKREFLDYVADIQEATQNISQFISDMTWPQFAQDQKTVYAVVRVRKEISRTLIHLIFRPPFADLQSRNPQNSTTVPPVSLIQIDQI